MSIMLSDILKIEENRTSTELNTVYLFREGGFYKAYNYSAWLVVLAMQKNAPDVKPLHVTKKVTKEGDNYVFVGFPLKSIDKFVPNYQIFQPISDVQINIELSAPDEQTSTEEYELWKNSIKLSAKDKKAEKAEKTPKRE